MNLSYFTSRLLQVIDWTNHLTKLFDYDGIHYGSVFRQTNPVIEGNMLYADNTDYAVWNISCLDIDNYKAALQIAFKIRDASTQKIYVESTRLSDLGRILCFTTLLTTNDGVAIIDSDCFLDENDVPPIDTWFALEESMIGDFPPVLYCWVPKRFESKIHKAMQHQIMSMYKWLDEEDPVFYNRVLSTIDVIH